MLTRPIPATGERLPVVGLGTWRRFDVHLPRDRDALVPIVAAFVSGDGAVIDSSPMYGEAEAVVGDLVTRLGVRHRVFLATKVWATGRSEGRRQIDQSFDRLQTDRIDLIQVHNLVDVHTQLPTLRALKAEGRVRYIGITERTAASHDAVAALVETEPLDFVQINYSAGEPEAADRLLRSARDRGVAVLANRPFGEGALIDRLRRRALPEWAGEIGCASWAELLLKFVIAHPAVTCVIPATSKIAHLGENLLAGSEPLPDDAMCARIRLAAAQQD